MIAKEIGEEVAVLIPSLEQNKTHTKKIMDTIVNLVVEKMKEKNRSGKPNAIEIETKKEFIELTKSNQPPVLVQNRTQILAAIYPLFPHYLLQPAN